MLVARMLRTRGHEGRRSKKGGKGARRSWERRTSRLSAELGLFGALEIFGLSPLRISSLYLRRSFRQNRIDLESLLPRFLSNHPLFFFSPDTTLSSATLLHSSVASSHPQYFSSASSFSARFYFSLCSRRTLTLTLLYIVESSDGRFREERA